MFTKTGMNSVQHSSGFTVQITGRYEIKYTQGDRILLIPVEPGLDLGIYGDSIQIWTAPLEEEISGEEKKAIISKIDEALNFLGIKHSFL